MSIEVTALGKNCNIECTYCYQAKERAAGGVQPYNIDKILEQVDAKTKGQLPQYSDFTVFGGEPLLLPIADLERLLKHSFDKSGKSGVQSNGTLITDAHVEMFKKYKTHVGISVDGPGVLNRARWNVTAQATDASTTKTLAAIERLLTEKIGCSVIVTLSRLNASKERLPQLLLWLKELRDKGLPAGNVRIHLMEVDSEYGKMIELTEEEQQIALLSIHQAEVHTGFAVDYVSDMVKLLTGQDDNVTCIWNACDPATTPAVYGIGPEGEITNCGRANKDGIDWIKANTPSQARQVNLYNTPYEDGGCKDCRFFVACKGQCPGEAIGGDSRNRSSQCTTWFRMFEKLERSLLDVRILPVSQRPDLKKVESVMMQCYEKDMTTNIKTCIAIVEGRYSVAGIVVPPDHTDLAPIAARGEKVER